MSENKNKPAILLVGVGIALAAAAIAVAAFLLARQEPAAPAASARPASSPASSPATAASASASAAVAPAPAQQASAAPMAASMAASMTASARDANEPEAAAASISQPVVPQPSAVKRDQTIDCSSPVRNHERLICSDDELLELDAKLAAAYRRSRAHSADPDYVRDAQRAWERDVRNRCETDTCLVKAYKRRIAVVADPLN